MELVEAMRKPRETASTEDYKFKIVSDEFYCTVRGGNH